MRHEEKKTHPNSLVASGLVEVIHKDVFFDQISAVQHANSLLNDFSNFLGLSSSMLAVRAKTNP